MFTRVKIKGGSIFIIFQGKPILSHINSHQPKVFGVKLSSIEIKRIFSTKIRNFKLFKMPKLPNFTFPEGCHFLNCDDAELKGSSKIFFSFSERLHWAVVG